MEDDCRLLLSLPAVLLTCLCVVSASVPVLVSSLVFKSRRRVERAGRPSMDNRQPCVGEVSSTSTATSLAARKMQGDLAMNPDDSSKIYDSILNLNIGGSSTLASSNTCSSWLRAVESHKFLPSPSSKSSPTPSSDSTPSDSTPPVTSRAIQRNKDKFALKPSRLKVADRPAPPPSSDPFSLMAELTLSEPFSTHQFPSSSSWSRGDNTRPPASFSSYRNPSNSLEATPKEPVPLNGLVRSFSNDMDTVESHAPSLNGLSNGTASGFISKRRRNGLRDAFISPSYRKGQSSQEAVTDLAPKWGRSALLRKKCGMVSTLGLLFFISLLLNTILASPYIYHYFYS